jgi:hypothetical protein
MKTKNRKIKQLIEFVENYKVTKLEKSKNNPLSGDNKVSSITNDTCMRPDIFLDNDRCCDNCPYYERCNCAIKRLSNEKKKRK